MNERINFQDLIALLAEEKSITKKDSEIFLKELFALVTEGILRDGQVKIKDLGTFKVSTVNPRESVNVQTGERLTIPAHKKVSFAPDKKISELVNAPYAHLEVIELESKTEENPQPELKETGTIKEVADIEKTEVKETEEVKPEVASIVTEITKPDTTIHVEKKEPVKEALHDLLTEPTLPPPPPKEYRKKPKAKTHFIARNPILSTFLILFVLVIVAWGTYSFISHSSKEEYLETLKSVEERTKLNQTPPLQKDTIIAFGESLNSVSEEETLRDSLEVEEVTDKTIDKEKQPEKTITIERGDRLTLISLREYGDKIFWVYLYMANKDAIDDPNNVAPGTVIKIPKPETYGIDKNSKESLLKAATIMQEIHNSKSK